LVFFTKTFEKFVHCFANGSKSSSIKNNNVSGSHNKLKSTGKYWIRPNA
jgi:hypothetical protein